MLKSLNSYNLKLISAILLLDIIMFGGSAKGQEQGINSFEWKFESQRKELAPVWYVDSLITYEGKPTPTAVVSVH